MTKTLLILVLFGICSTHAGNFFISTSWSRAMGWCNHGGSKLYIGDFNGDGRSDMLCHDQVGHTWTILANGQGNFNGQSTLYNGNLRFCKHAGSELLLGDFNGDKRTDMMCHDTQGNLETALATSAGYFTGRTWNKTLKWCNHKGSQMLVGDFNGDERDDILCHDTAGNKWLSHAQPGGTFAGTTWRAGIAGWCGHKGGQLLIDDFNGDGRDDMLCHDYAGNKWVALATCEGTFTTSRNQSKTKTKAKGKEIPLLASLSNIAYTSTSIWPGKTCGKLHNPEYVSMSDSKGYWATSSGGLRNPKEYVQIDLKSQYTVSAIETKGTGLSGCAYREWTTSYKIEYSADNSNWQFYQQQGNLKVFTGNTDETSLVKHSLSPPITARSFRIYPINYRGWKSIQVELYGNGKAAATPLGPVVTSWHGLAGMCAGHGAHLLTGHFNDDARADLMCHKEPGGEKSIALARRDYRNLFARIDWTRAMGWCGFSGGELHIGDFNGDGKDDLLCHDKPTGKKWISYNQHQL